MIPRPPIWISARITPCPNPDQYTGVSVTMSPVRHVADVEVNNASTRLAPAPVSVATGSINSIVPPAAMAAANPNATTRVGGQHCASRGTPNNHPGAYTEKGSHDRSQ